jgi:predicted ester cyclase
VFPVAPTPGHEDDPLRSRFRRPIVSKTNTQLVLQALRALAGGDLDAYVELHHPDYVNHEAAAGHLRGADAAHNTATFLHGAFDDLELEPLDTVSEHDLVVVRARFSGRQVGPLDGFAPSGRSCSVQHIHIYRVTEGKISEHWACRDDLGAARQMGLLPTAVAA